MLTVVLMEVPVFWKMTLWIGILIPTFWKRPVPPVSYS